MTTRTAPSLLLMLVLVAGLACAAAEPEPVPVALDTEEQKLLYALGVVISARLPHINLTEEELGTVQAGLVDGLRGQEPRVDMQSLAPKIEPYLLDRVKAATEQEKEAGKTFREAEAQQPGAVTTESGLVYRELQAGSGDSPAADDSVRINYRGTLRDGSQFDASDEPVTFALGGVVRCFSEGLQRMKVGGKARLVCPSELAYGDNGFPPRIRPGATLAFEIELLEIVKPEPAESAGD